MYFIFRNFVFVFLEDRYFSLFLKTLGTRCFFSFCSHLCCHHYSSIFFWKCMCSLCVLYVSFLSSHSFAFKCLNRPTYSSKHFEDRYQPRLHNFVKMFRHFGLQQFNAYFVFQFDFDSSYLHCCFPFFWIFLECKFRLFLKMQGHIFLFLLFLFIFCCYHYYYTSFLWKYVHFFVCLYVCLICILCIPWFFLYLFCLSFLFLWFSFGYFHCSKSLGPLLSGFFCVFFSYFALILRSFPIMLLSPRFSTLIFSWFWLYILEFSLFRQDGWLHPIPGWRDLNPLLMNSSPRTRFALGKWTELKKNFLF